jgi:hypothetical protein
LFAVVLRAEPLNFEWFGIVAVVCLNLELSANCAWFPSEMPAFDGVSHGLMRRGFERVTASPLINGSNEILWIPAIHLSQRCGPSVKVEPPPGFRFRTQTIVIFPVKIVVPLLGTVYAVAATSVPRVRVGVVFLRLLENATRIARFRLSRNELSTHDHIIDFTGANVLAL